MKTNMFIYDKNQNYRIEVRMYTNELYTCENIICKRESFIKNYLMNKWWEIDGKNFRIRK